MTTPPALFTVVTYNILSSALADPGWFTHCDPADLNPDTRLARVLAKLTIHTDKRAVICLQEVSREWCGKLHVFFQRHNYTFIASLYGGAVNGYMGVGLAFPNDVWAAEDVDIRRVSDTKEWHVPPRREWRPAASVRPARPGDWTCPACRAHVFAGKTACYKCKAPKPAAEPEPLLSALWSWLRSSVGAPAAPPDPPAPAAPDAESVPEWYDAARRKENTMVAVLLRSLTQPSATIWLGTYHMPCAFMQPMLMATHAALAAQHLQRLAARTNAPCALAGDFNIQPGDPTYRLLTSGQMDDATSAAFPKPPAEDGWTPTLCCAMASAYAAAHGHEPDFTNHAQVRDEPAFVGCLDYVFVSPHMRVVGAPALPHRESPDAARPMPTCHEPSDHLLLAVDLELSASEAAVHAAAYGTKDAGSAAVGGAGGGAYKRQRVGAAWRAEENERLRQGYLAELHAFVAGEQRSLDFSPQLNSFERKLVHALAEELGLRHASHGEGDERCIRVEKPPPVVD